MELKDRIEQSRRKLRYTQAQLAALAGTKDCVRQALAAGIPAWLADSEDGEPTRVKAEMVAR